MSDTRVFVDSFGFHWNVLELPSAATVPRGLYFLSRGVSLVLRDYPGDWAQYAWADLEDLCARAELVGGGRSVSVRPLAARVRDRSLARSG